MLIEASPSLSDSCRRSCSGTRKLLNQNGVKVQQFCTNKLFVYVPTDEETTMMMTNDARWLREVVPRKNALENRGEKTKRNAANRQQFPRLKRMDAMKTTVSALRTRSRPTLNGK